MSHLSARPLALIATIAASIAGANNAQAANTPRILQTSTIAAKRVIPAHGRPYYSLSAVVRLSGALPINHNNLGLVATTWATRSHIDVGTRLPDALFAGSGLGRVGTAGRHCYRAEIAQLTAHHTVKAGLSWRVALHDGRRVLRTAPRVRLSTKVSESQQLEQLGC